MIKEETAAGSESGTETESSSAAELAGYLAPTWFINSDDPRVVALAREIVGRESDPLEQAVRLFYGVRDGARYTAYNLDLRREALRATSVLDSGGGWCVSKSVLLAALCRAVNIPCRLGYANVCNHLATKKLLDFLTTNIFYYHGYNEIYLRGRWVKATVAFNRTLCEKARLGTLEFDGIHDSIYHPFDLAGQRYMEYLQDYGVFADLPYEAMVDCFAEVYPNVPSPHKGAPQQAQLEGDFEAEIAREAENA